MQDGILSSTLPQALLFFSFLFLHFKKSTPFSQDLSLINKSLVNLIVIISLTFLVVGTDFLVFLILILQL